MVLPPLRAGPLQGCLPYPEPRAEIGHGAGFLRRFGAQPVIDGDRFDVLSQMLRPPPGKVQKSHGIATTGYGHAQARGPVAGQAGIDGGQEGRILALFAQPVRV